jgi:hypothetical protein
MRGNGVRVLIVGAGIAGLATARTLHGLGAQVEIVDGCSSTSRLPSCGMVSVPVWRWSGPRCTGCCSPAPTHYCDGPAGDRPPLRRRPAGYAQPVPDLLDALEESGCGLR